MALLFAVIRNQALNANGFFYTPPTAKNATSTTRISKLQVSAARSGFPKLVDLRNKAFFFFSGERSRAKDLCQFGHHQPAHAGFPQRRLSGSFPMPTAIRFRSTIRSMPAATSSPTPPNGRAFPAMAC